MAAGGVTKRLESSALTLTSVATMISAQRTLCAKIVPEITAVCVIPVSKGILARIVMSAPLATLATLMPHVQILREATFALAKMAIMAME